jgi:hypothetical protein
MNAHANSCLPKDDKFLLKKIVFDIATSVIIVTACGFLIDVIISHSSMGLPSNLIGAISIFFDNGSYFGPHCRGNIL